MVRPVKTAARAAFLELELLAAHAYQDTAGVRALVSEHDAFMNFVNLHILEQYNFRGCIFNL